MAHNINDGNVVLYRTPAWHGLGTVTQEPLTAWEASDLIDIPTITLLPAYYAANSNEFSRAPGYNLIIGEQQTTKHCYGAVSDRYNLFSHWEAIAAWSVNVPQHIETIGLLGKGETLFLTTQLPSMDIRGDEVRPYLSLLNPCNGIESIRACLTPIRMVCQNTVNLGLSCATESITVNHLSDPSDRVHQWLAEVWQRTAQNCAIIQEALALLASRDAYDVDMTYIARTIYPTTTYDINADLDTLAAAEKANKANKAHQEAVLFMFQDSETITSATQGTLWGAYNAVAEYEDHFKQRNTPRNKMYGESAARKRHAFDLCMSLA